MRRPDQRPGPEHARTPRPERTRQPRPDRSPRPGCERSRRPLLKWAGGKRQLLPELRRYYPPAFSRYIEPFFGSGAVFFDLYASGRLAGREVVLIDSNPDLIGCYEMVRDAPERVIRALDALAAGHARDPRGHYYAVRDGRFNPERERRRDGGGGIAYTPELAAMLIYLNRTGFNGLFRLNARGGFNVPAGRYERPRINDRARVEAAAEALGTPGVRLRYASFETALEIAEAGDFLYVDPPYAPVGPTANFTAYTASRFGEADQRRLQKMTIALARRGCRVLVSNSTAAEIVRLYETDAEARAAGLRARRVAARRAINRDALGRRPVQELLVTNIEG
jgi:DNA adenine methylase